MNKVFSPYVDVLRRVIDLPDERDFGLNFSGPTLENRSTQVLAKRSSQSEELARLILPLLQDNSAVRRLAELMGIPNPELRLPRVGDHPDFGHLRAQPFLTEEHYIVSCFIDVKGSTHLFRRYSKEKVHAMTQVMIVASTHICALFGGHIQRIQGDGVFVYFGGKTTAREAACRNALLATSFFSYFIKFELPQLFEFSDLKPLRTRTGIDFGDDEDVLWGVSGIGACTELTTTSLHTSLAPKMQANADANGIMIGNHVKTRIGLWSEFCDIKSDAAGKELRYIWEDREKSVYYTQWRFDWTRFLRQEYSHFVKVDERGNLYLEYLTPAEQVASRAEEQRLAQLKEALPTGAYLAPSLQANSKIQPPSNPHYGY